VTALSGSTPAYAPSPPGKGLQAMPALTFTWDGTPSLPTLTVKQGGVTCVTYSGQALIQDSVPVAVMSAASGGNSWEVGP